MAFEKLKFWKKEEDTVPDEMPVPVESEGFPPGIEPEQPSFVESFRDLHQTSSTGNIDRDIQLILSRLDTIKATLENINHRLENIERLARE